VDGWPTEERPQGRVDSPDEWLDVESVEGQGSDDKDGERPAAGLARLSTQHTEVGLLTRTGTRGRRHWPKEKEWQFQPYSHMQTPWPPGTAVQHAFRGAGESSRRPGRDPSWPARRPKIVMNGRVVGSNDRLLWPKATSAKKRKV
jgi:hypothetical protein